MKAILCVAFLVIESKFMYLSKPFVLASRSPRRILLLSQIGISASVVPADLPEDFNASLSAAENAVQLSFEKARAVAPQCTDSFIVGADTIVVLGDVLLAKPENPEDAKRMLRVLSGKTHTVITGFTILDSSSGESVSDFESTAVTFRNLPDEEIDEYVAGGSPMDKAGAYGIQDDYGAVFVTRIDGCFYNVVGFPLSKFYLTFEKFQMHLKEQRTYVENN